MKRNCYGCERILTLEEAVDGQVWNEWIMNCPTVLGFEGWVHCKGPTSQFLQEKDEELLLAMENAFPHNTGVRDWVGCILVCVSCVKEKFEEETGIRLMDDRCQS